MGDNDYYNYFVMIATTISCWFFNVNTVLYDDLDVVWEDMRISYFVKRRMYQV